MRHCLFIAFGGGLFGLCLFLSSWVNLSRKNGYIKIQDKSELASQMTIPNTIYEICYEFDLNNTKLVIPKGSTLKFSGGRIKNGHISFNDTRIITNQDGIFHNITTHLDGSPVRNKVRIDWFSNSDNNDYKNWASALTIAKSLVFERNKVYHFTRNTLGYSIIRRDIYIEGNNSTIVLEPNYQLRGSNYCALIYHTRNLTVKNLNFSVLTSMVPSEDGKGDRKTIDLFYGEDPTGHEGDDLSAHLENINIYVKYADSGLSSLYNAKQGTRFVLKKCNLFTKESNTQPGGGSLAWFMFKKANRVSIKIIDCYAEANGQDECIGINPSGEINDDIIIDAYIGNCSFINKYDDGKGSNCAGLISMHPNTEQTKVQEGNSFMYNVVIENCLLKGIGAATNVARFYAAKRTSMNVECEGTRFIYEGKSDFPINQMQNGMILLTKDRNPSIPCSFLFKNCSFEGKYIMSCRYQYWENGEVSFNNCSFNCDSFVCSEEFSRNRESQQATFKKCKFLFNTDSISMGFGSPVFKSCRINSHEDSIHFSGDASLWNPSMRQVKLNGKRVADIQH